MAQVEIVPIVPFEDGVAEGRNLGRPGLTKRMNEQLASKVLRGSIGAMSRDGLRKLAVARMETPPNYTRFPELADIYPEKLDYFRGLAEGADMPLADVAMAEYVAFRHRIDEEYQRYQLNQGGDGRCSTIILVGPDGVLCAHSAESNPEHYPPITKRNWPPPQHVKIKPAKPKLLDLKVRKPRTGYIEDWGVTNEKGVGGMFGVSCGTWLDEPVEDTWPIGKVPLLRFAASVDHLLELWHRYSLHNWTYASVAVADRAGDAAIVEKSHRRIGVRRIKRDRDGTGVLWATEGHFESPEMFAFLRAKRLEYVERAGKHLGAGDLQYATDCHVRFTHIGELCHQPWGRGYDHMRRILTDHAPFPRAVCRHGGPDTDEYDRSITMASTFVDLTHNRGFSRGYVPGKKFACETPEKGGEYPRVPG